jgi:hypothetical protein
MLWYLLKWLMRTQVVAAIAKEWSEAAARAQAVCVPAAAQTK